MVFEKISNYIVENFAVTDDLTMDTDIVKDLELDSLDIVEFIMYIEDEFGFDIPDEDAEQLHTMGDIVRYIEDHE